MLTLQRTGDPEMGQELYAVNCMLHLAPNRKITQQGRLSLMDGSESDDEDQHSCRSILKEAESQPRAVPVFFII